MAEAKFPQAAILWQQEPFDAPLPVILEEEEEQEEDSLATTAMISYQTTGSSKVLSTTATSSLELRQRRSSKKRATVVFVLFNCINFLIGVGYSMQSPFFPMEAEKKGVSSSVYGFIFGVFQLTNLFLSPVYGKYIRVIGAKFLLNVGSYVMAFAFVLFGFLDLCEPGLPFTASSFAVRVTEAVGNSAFTTACYTITAQQFSDAISGSFAYLQASFAAGMIVGPTLGGYLYEVGGFSLPFFVAGALMSLMAVVTSCLLPPIDVKQPSTRDVFTLFLRPSVLISCCSLFAIAFSFGFVASILEPHLRQFQLRPSLLGCIFVIDGLVCALVNRLWGCLAETQISLKLLTSCGAWLLAASFLLMGPAPFLPVEPLLWLTCVSLVLYGLGIGGEFLLPFIDIIQEAIRLGYPDNVETYGISSGLWSSASALGEFVGPSVAGVLNDAVGFRHATLLAFALHCFAGVLNLSYYMYAKRSSSATDLESQFLIASSTQS